MSSENFNQRNILKQSIDEKRLELFYVNEREIWYVHLGINIGYEENGKGDDHKRPVLVIKKLGNLFLCVPLTTKGKDGFIYYHKISNKYFGKRSHLIISQPRVIDKKRFIEHIQTINCNDFVKIKKKLTTFWL